MPRVRDVPCSGGCGNLIWRGNGCLPPGQSMCHPCRRERRARLSRELSPPRAEEREAAHDALRTFVCEACGVVFARPPGKYEPRSCGTNCAEALRRQQRDEEHPCPDCDAPVSGFHTKRCPDCRIKRQQAIWARKNAKRAERRRASSSPRYCGHCGNEIAEAHWRTRYCSEACLDGAVAAVRPPAKDCSICVAQFEGRGKTCSIDCAREAQLRYDRERNARRSSWDRSPRSCQRCKRTFEPVGPLQTYCDQACMKRARRARERVRGTRHSGDLHRERARLYGRRYVPIKPLTIYERDGWVCQICLRRVPRGKKSPHPLSPTLDHIIPMSCEGGDHVPENVRLAHRSCNTKRGVGRNEAVQLTLIG